MYRHVLPPYLSNLRREKGDACRIDSSLAVVLSFLSYTCEYVCKEACSLFVGLTTYKMIRYNMPETQRLVLLRDTATNAG